MLLTSQMAGLEGQGGHILAFGLYDHCQIYEVPHGTVMVTLVSSCIVPFLRHAVGLSLRLCPVIVWHAIQGVHLPPALPAIDSRSPFSTCVEEWLILRNCLGPVNNYGSWTPTPGSLSYG